MKTVFEVLNIDLPYEFTKRRKKELLKKLDIGPELESKVIAEIDKMQIPDDDERYHWIQKLGRTAGADLLTLGKVQPENMLAMSALPKDDFQEAVKVATSSAREWNSLTIEAEKDLNQETINNTIS